MKEVAAIAGPGRMAYWVRMETAPAPSRAHIAVLITAAGRGERMGGDLPKQWQELAGQPVLARDAGLISGVVPGGASVKRAAMLQPGNRLSLRWRARLDDQLGSFSAEPARARPGLMADADALAGLNAVTALIRWALPERDPHPRLTDATEALLDAIAAGAAVPDGAAGAGGLSAPLATAVASFAENGPPDHPAGKQPRGLFSDPPPIPGARKPRDIYNRPKTWRSRMKKAAPADGFSA